MIDGVWTCAARISRTSSGNAYVDLISYVMQHAHPISSHPIQLMCQLRDTLIHHLHGHALHQIMMSCRVMWTGITVASGWRGTVFTTAETGEGVGGHGEMSVTHEFETEETEEDLSVREMTTSIHSLDMCTRRAHDMPSKVRTSMHTYTSRIFKQDDIAIDTLTKQRCCTFIHGSCTQCVVDLRHNT